MRHVTAACSARTPSKQTKPKPSDTTSTKVAQLSTSQLLKFERKGWCITKDLLSTQLIEEIKRDVRAHIKNEKLTALRHRIRVLCPGTDPLSVRDEREAMRVLRRQGVDEVGFLQFFHLNQRWAAVRKLVFSRQVAGTAAQLLGVDRVRLYQDCVFLKEPGYAPTNWHSDLRMAPFDTNSYVTAWIPLRNVGGGEGDSGLKFAEGSHRDFALPFWHELQGRDLGDRGYKVASPGPLAVGDVTWHHGWTLHYAPPQPPSTPPRLALSVSYIADGTRLLARISDPTVKSDLAHNEDYEGYSEWLEQMEDGAVARHPSLPIAFPVVQQK